MIDNERGHVAIATEYGVDWDFIVPSEAVTYSEQANEMATLCTTIFDSFDDFLTPIELTYTIQLYQENRNVSAMDTRTEPGETLERSLRNESGITAHEFVASTQVDRATIRSIPRVPFDHNRVKLHCNDSERSIDRTDCVVYRKGEPVNWEPTWDPLDVRIAFAPNRHHPAVGSEYMYHISVGLMSDVWIKQTKAGTRNRTTLSRFLERLSDSLPSEQVVRDVYHTSDFWIDLDLQRHAGDFDPKNIY
ncbi:hypothetical protein [Halopiger djelfimassiliensis]|uniref:hypothetical protein n=1 Tax=Halopiger djelfimassiliensis TaxID=1293047 RepID=UPI0012B5303F|nr:hypothetical protein [Halopiger djelfimassiliensis]